MVITHGQTANTLSWNRPGEKESWCWKPERRSFPGLRRKPRVFQQTVSDGSCHHCNRELHQITAEYLNRNKLTKICLCPGVWSPAAAQQLLQRLLLVCIYSQEQQNVKSYQPSMQKAKKSFSPAIGNSLFGCVALWKSESWKNFNRIQKQ